jgi:hypothetical protein
MKIFSAFYSSTAGFISDSTELLNSFNNLGEAIAEMEIGHRYRFPNDTKWEKESGFIFDLEDNKYYKFDETVWQENLEIPDSYQKLIKSLIK